MLLQTALVSAAAAVSPLVLQRQIATLKQQLARSITHPADVSDLAAKQAIAEAKEKKRLQIIAGKSQNRAKRIARRRQLRNVTAVLRVPSVFVGAAIFLMAA